MAQIVEASHLKRTVKSDGMIASGISDSTLASGVPSGGASLIARAFDVLSVERVNLSSKPRFILFWKRFRKFEKKNVENKGSPRAH